MWVVLAALLSLVAAGVWVWWATSREVVSPITHVSTSGAAGRALIVYHPGLSDFPDRVTEAFADGLSRAGWQVDRTTASRETSIDLHSYALLVLGSPVYANAPAAPLSHYLDRLGDLRDKPVALVFTAAGDAGPALQSAAEKVMARHGRIVGRFGYTTQRPNESPQGYTGSNTDRAVAMARDAGKALRSATP